MVSEEGSDDDEELDDEESDEEYYKGMPELEDDSEDEDEDEDDDGEVDEDREKHDDEVAEAVRTEVFATLSLNPDVLRVGKEALTRIRKLARRIHYSLVLRQALHQFCEQTKVPIKILPRAVVTRWNSVTVTLGAALDIRPALNLLIGASKYRLGRLTLSEEHWMFVVEIHPILEVSLAFIFIVLVLITDSYYDRNFVKPLSILNVVIGHSFMRYSQPSTS